MATIQVGTENSDAINIYYEDYGQGFPIVLIHGWPLSSSSWEKQIPELLNNGYRVITYDRRGFGKSSHPSTGYTANNLASDLDVLMNYLNLSEATLVGFSMGGAEVARYLGKYGTERVRKAAFISSFTQEHSNIISDEAVHLSWITGVGASAIGSIKAVDAWLEDFRQDLMSLTIPVLVVHGKEEKTVPIDVSGAHMDKIITNCEFHAIEGAPHGLNWTHANELNEILLNFVNHPIINYGASPKNFLFKN